MGLGEWAGWGPRMESGLKPHAGRVDLVVRVGGQHKGPNVWGRYKIHLKIKCIAIESIIHRYRYRYFLALQN